MSEQVRCDFLTAGVEETVGLGRRIAAAVEAGSIIGLRGPLGAGKTELVRGLAAGLGITEEISSPTFVLEAVYEIPDREGALPGRTLHHWDLYRITTGTIDCDLFDNAGDRRKITAVEWPERVPAVQDLLDVDILLDFSDSAAAGSDRMPSEDTGGRRISISVRRGSDLVRLLANIDK